MRTVLIIACLCLMSSAQREDRRAYGLTRIFSITMAQANECIQKTDATGADFDVLEETISDPESNPASRESARKASCVVVCAAQFAGLMNGAKLQIPEIHNFIDKCAMSTDSQNVVHTIVDLCSEEMESFSDTDECDLGLEFAKCLIAKSKK